MWDGLSGARIDFAAWDVSSATNSGTPEMSRFVENIHLQKALLENLKEQNNVEIIDKTRVQEIVQGNLKSQGGWPIVKLENGRTIRARLLVSQPISAWARSHANNTTIPIGWRRRRELASEELLGHQD